MIYTFYSFKGGVGRSMAMANIATLLYDEGLRVLMIDWDLEAPGLEGYFAQHFASEFDQKDNMSLRQAFLGRVHERDGLIDMLLDYKARLKQSSLGEADIDLPTAVIPDLHDYLTPLAGDTRRPPDNPTAPCLTLFTAGNRTNPTRYAQRVLSFDWDDFYLRWKGEPYIEWLSQQWREHFDVILVDSRTGMTEMSGVCTYQLADVIVMLCASNPQNLEGTLTMTDRFLAAQNLPVRRNRPLQVVVVPARLDDSTETDLYRRFSDEFVYQFEQQRAETFTPLLDIIEAAEIEPPESPDRRSLLALKLRYFPRYTYEEALAVREETEAPALVTKYRQLALVLKRMAPNKHVLSLHGRRFTRGNQVSLFSLQKVLNTFQDDPDRAQDLAPATLFARLTDLAIFPPGEEIPVSVLGSAWRIFSGDSRYDPSGGGNTAVAIKHDPLAASSASQQAHPTAELRLASLANALCTTFYEGGVLSHYDRSRRTAVIDPALADYLRAQHTPTSLTDAQTKFLTNYDTDPKGLVTRLLAAPHDERRYLWQFLPHHMQSAGQEEQLCALVLQRDYLAGKLVVLDATAVEEDMLLAQNITFKLDTFDKLEEVRQQWGRIAHLLERTRQKTQTQTSDLLQRWRILSQTLAFWLPEIDVVDGAAFCQPLVPPLLLEPSMRRVFDHATYTGNDNTAVKQNEANVHSVASTPDGSIYITGLADGRLVGWSAVTGEQLGVWHRHSNLVHDVQISPSGRWLASAGLFDCLRLWAWDEALLDWEEVFAFPGAAVCCQFDPAERWLAVTFDDKVCRLFALEHGRVIAQLQGHGAVAIAPNGEIIATAVDDEILTWQVPNEEQTNIPLQNRLQGHSGQVHTLAFASDSRTLFSGGEDETVRRWDITSGTLQATWHEHERGVIALTPTLDGQQLVSGAQENGLYVWPLAAESAPSAPRYVQAHNQAVTDLHLDLVHGRVLSTSLDQTLRVWDIAPNPTKDEPRGKLWGLAFIPGTTEFFTAATRDPFLRRWRWIETGKIELVSTLSTAEDKPFSGFFDCQVSADGRFVVAAGISGAIAIWSVEDGKLRHHLPAHEGMIIGIDIAPDGHTVASCGIDLTVQVWDVETGQIRHRLRGHERRVNRCRFLRKPSAEGERGLQLASMSSDNTARIWDVETGACLHVLAGHDAAVLHIAETPLGLVTTSSDKTMRVWDVRAGELESVERMVLQGHEAPVWQVATDAEGLSLFSVSDDGTWRVWNAKQGRVRHTFYVDEQLISQAQHPDRPGLFLLAGKLGLHIVKYPE